MSTNPLIVVGDVISNIPPDTLRVSYTKYNNHYHTEATTDSFSYYPITIGDTVNVYNNGQLILESSRVLRITNSQIELESITNNNILLVNCNLTVLNKNINIPQINVPAMSNILEIVPNDGFIDSLTLSRIKTQTLTIINRDYVLNERIILVPPELFSLFRIKRIIVHSINDGLNSVILSKINEELELVANHTINIINKKAVLVIEEYTLGDIFTYVQEGLAITPIGISNPTFTITLELITP